ncbi:type I-E CRISPR-associated protein Cse1/CasA (plasmid) [Kitasatospora sp. NBC_00070]|uniref:type I-E CRISPR-associated protein Cse1/CasA n=1 Tax=Kitasatospora sp. NBC_00070 TaxID=2975962 RepID=UPI002F9197B0
MPITPPPTYDLFDEPWIPVRWRTPAAPGEEGRDQHPHEVGLHELLTRAHDIARITAALPPAVSALHRVLYAITARVTGLDEAGPSDNWAERRAALARTGRFDSAAIHAYIREHRGRFNLFDPQRPFLQDPRLARECDTRNTAGVDRLVTTRPSGNNHAWFQHVDSTSPEPPTPGQATLHLLVWHYYGPSGRCSSRTAGDTTAANTTAGPLRGSLSYHPEGISLFETLLAGLPEPDRTVSRSTDRCPWEWTALPDPVSTPPKPTGPCSRLTARSQHALLLIPDSDGNQVTDAFITWAWRDKIPGPDDPYLIWQTSKEGRPYPRPADTHRGLWRDLDALLLKTPGGTAQPRRPEVFETAPEISAQLRIRALGFEQDGQARDTQFIDTTTPPVLALAEETDQEAALAVQRLRELGERYGQRLDRAVKKAWAQFTDAPKISDCTWAEEAAARYWPAAETEFWEHLRDRDFTGATGLFRAHAEQAYDTVTHRAMGTQRGARACTAARIELYGGPVRPTTESTGTTRRATSTDQT